MAELMRLSSFAEIASTIKGQSEIAAQRQAEASALPELKLTLDDLLREAMDIQTEAEQVRKERRKLVRDSGEMTAEQREAMRVTVLRWESEHEWTPRQFVAVERVDTCTNCGAVSAHFIGLYELQQGRRPEQGWRFVLWSPQAVIGDAASLPRAYFSEERSIPVCPKCMWEAGFALRYEGEVKL